MYLLLPNTGHFFNIEQSFQKLPINIYYLLKDYSVFLEINFVFSFQ